jgi:hypothetical protein
MGGIQDGETSQGAKGVGSMGLDPRSRRHTSFVGLTATNPLSEPAEKPPVACRKRRGIWRKVERKIEQRDDDCRTVCSPATEKKKKRKHQVSIKGSS